MRDQQTLLKEIRERFDGLVKGGVEKEAALESLTARYSAGIVRLALISKIVHTASKQGQAKGASNG